MDVLIIPSWYPTIDNKLNGIFFKEQAEALYREGGGEKYKVTIIYIEIYSLKQFFKLKGKTKLDRKIENGLEVYRYKTFNWLPKMNALPIVYYIALRKIYKIAFRKTSKPDIVHIHSCLWAGFGGVKLAQSKKIPVLITEHASMYARNLIKKREEIYIKYALNNADLVISVSKSLKDEIGKYIKNKSRSIVIPNMINTNFFNMEDKSLKNSKFTFFSLGFLDYNKGFDIVIKAFSKLCLDEEVQLVIGGSGREKDNLTNLVKKLGIEDKVCFLGNLDRNEVLENMRRCDAFVLGSRYETFGIVIIEALACGKPVIATKSGGPADIINEKNGYLVDINDIESMYSSMKKIIENKEQFASNIIRDDCIKRFSEEAVVEKLTKVYDKLVFNI